MEGMALIQTDQWQVMKPGRLTSVANKTHLASKRLL